VGSIVKLTGPGGWRRANPGGPRKASDRPLRDIQGPLNVGDLLWGLSWMGMQGAGIALRTDGLGMARTS
jgi:hypothetical protein